MFNQFSASSFLSRLRCLGLVLGSLAVVPLTITSAEAGAIAANSVGARVDVTKEAAVEANASRKGPRRRVLRRTRRPSGSQSRLPAPPRRLPPNRVQPGGGLSSAARSCETADGALTALVPVANPVFTTSATPSFLFYFPDGPESIDYAEFTLLTSDEKEQVYTKQFSPTAAGISTVSLPTGAGQGLEVGGAYHWYLNVHCKAGATVLTVDGWAQRVASADEVTLAEGAELPLVWYDAIATVSENVVADGSNGPARQQWASWLNAAGLAELISVPVLGEVDATL